MCRSGQFLAISAHALCHRLNAMKGVASVKYANRLLTFNISNLKLN